MRLRSPSGFVVDLIGATCGIEAEIVSRATVVSIDVIGEMPVARAEELLSMKVLSLSDRRLQYQIDARNLATNMAATAVEQVAANLRLITERGYHRGQDLEAKLAATLEAARLDLE